MLVEDQAAYREVITLALKHDQTIELISQYGTAEFALRQIQSPTAKNVPDIVLLDLNLPGMSGLEAIPWFKKYSPNTKIIILTQSEAEADVLQAIRSGASGYLLKSSSPNQIKDSIQMVMNGGASLDDRLARFILDTLVDKLPGVHLRGLQARATSPFRMSAAQMPKRRSPQVLVRCLRWMDR